MSDLQQHEEIASLIGAYVLDAVDDEERAAVEAHLGSCPICRDEADSLQATIGMMANEGGPAPMAIWERIEAALEDQPAPMATITPARPARRIPIAIATAALAIAAVLAVFFGIEVQALNHRIGTLTTNVETSSTRAIATAALLQPGSRQIPLKEPNGHQLGVIVLLPSGQGVMTALDMRALPTTQTYQLWAITGGTPVSLGLLGSRPGVTLFRVDNHGVFDLAVTVEPAGGTPRPTHTPIAVASVA